MAKFLKEEAIRRLEKICDEYSKVHPKNPTAVVSVNGQESFKAIIASYLSYTLFNKIMYVINNSDNEYWIRSENNNVVIQISFFR